MKAFSFAHYKVLLKVFFSNIFVLSRLKKNKSNNTPSLESVNVARVNVKKVFGTILTVFLAVLFLFYLAMMAVSLTKIAVATDKFSVLPYSIIGMGQLLILFLGMGATFNMLYFSGDNELLASLPVSETTVFMAKFTVSYVSQLLVSICLLLPTLIACGVSASVLGMHVPVSFYFLAVFTPLVAPLLPLLAVTIISIPIMYFVSFFKNRELIKNVLSIVVSFGFMALYLAFVFSSYGITGEGETTILPSAIINVGRFAIFNYHWVEAMLGRDVALNVFLYFIIIIVALAVIFTLSALTYKKAVSFSLEKGTCSFKKHTKSNKTDKYSSNGFVKMFFIKDLKTIISEPTLLLSMLMGIVFIPVFTAISSKLMFADMELNLYTEELLSLGFVTYLSFVMLGSTNYSSLTGITIEGKNITLIKSLPIECKDLIKGKLLVANTYCLIVSLEFFVAFALTSKTRLGPLVGLIAAVFMFIGGFGASCFCLYSDLKKPNFQWENMAQMTKNNKKMFSRVIMNVGLGLLFFISAIIAALVLKDNPLASHGVFFALFATVCVLYAIVAFNKLWKNKEKLFDAIEC